MSFHHLKASTASGRYCCDLTGSQRSSFSSGVTCSCSMLSFPFSYLILRMRSLHQAVICLFIDRAELPVSRKMNLSKNDWSMQPP